MTFKVGDKVVCIKKDLDSSYYTDLIIGNTYKIKIVYPTIKKVYVEHFAYVVPMEHFELAFNNKLKRLID